MSATSACRIKDRNGGAVVVAGSKPLKPYRVVTSPIPISVGKENSSSGSGLIPKAQIRPATRPKTRPDNPAGAQRRSTSSVARGRSPSPWELVRDRRVSAERSASSASKSVSRVRASDFGRERKGVSVKSSELGTEIGARVSRVSKVDVVSEKISKINLNCDSNKASVRKVRESSDESSAKFGNGIGMGKKETSVKIVKEVKVSEVSGAKETHYQSKLHEKLAFLEGKVKRIASDIKRTKEILDQNNPDASKVILSDIQDKITGIEKAMGQVGPAPGPKISNGIGVDVVRKSSVNGLNRDELEARLFPHHKLLKNRATDSFKTSLDENPIAVEFLASLEKEASIGIEGIEVEETDGPEKEGGGESSEVRVVRNDGVELVLTTDETLDESEDQEHDHGMNIEDEIEDNSINQVNQIGLKVSTGGWFVSEGESVLLAHDNGSCSFHDVVNTEEKAIYKPPERLSLNMWRDCWVIRAPSADGCAGRYVVAASAGNCTDSGFCSWDFYTREVRALHVEVGASSSSRTVLGPLPSDVSHPRQWWYRPCGPLLVTAGCGQKAVSIFDIRDGERIMKWDSPRPVVSMDYSSPLQWRNRGKVIVAETESVSLWDVNSLTAQALLSVPYSGQKISALHVNNSDAELGGGVRQRLSSAEAEGNEGVFCTQDLINVLDFRHPTGLGLKISNPGSSVHSVFSRGDSVFLGCTSSKPGPKIQFSSEIQQFSLRKQRLVNTFEFPERDADSNQAAITQVWGNSNHVMGVCGSGLFVFDASRDDEIHCFTSDHAKTRNVREVVGPEDMYLPSFDYSGCRALLISRDRPAMCRHLA